MTRKNIGLVLILLVTGCGSPSGGPSEGGPTPGPSPSPASGAGDHEAAKVDELRTAGYFYDLPDPMPTGELGELLKVTIRVNEPDQRVYRAMYRSTTADGATPVAVTGEIWVPSGLPPAGGFPIVAFGPGFGGIGDDCAYSIHPEWGYESLLEALVDDGFVVASTDWEGHGTPLPYMDSVQESATHSLLDGARAAMDLLGPAASSQVLIVGHSLGGVAAAQSLLHGPDYDEGLDIRGVVSMEGIGDFYRPGDDGAPGPDDVGVLDPMRVARSWSFGYPELKPEDVLTTDGVELLGRMDEDGTCDEVFWLELNGKPLHEVPLLDVTTIDWITVEPWAARIRAQTVTAAPYPVFYVMAEGPFAARVRDVADRLCEGSDHVAYRAYPTDHDGVVDLAYPDYRTWLRERLSGDSSFDGCDF